MCVVYYICTKACITGRLCLRVCAINLGTIFERDRERNLVRVRSTGRFEMDWSAILKGADGESDPCSFPSENHSPNITSFDM